QVAPARTGDRGASVPAVPGIPQSVADEAVVLDYGETRSLESLAPRLGEIAAVLVEPVLQHRPALQPRQFLHRLRALTADAGTPAASRRPPTGVPRRSSPP